MKKLNNKGFSLVELIIVIAIMAVLIGVLAPQFLRYVERSRYQKDTTAIEELRKAVEIALGNEQIATDVGAAIAGGGAGGNVVLTYATTGAITASGVASLDAEYQAAVGTTLRLSSNAYTTTTVTPLNVTISVNPTGGFLVQANGVQADGTTARQW